MSGLDHEAVISGQKTERLPYPADCKFDHQMISHAQRMAALTGRTAASKDLGERQLRAVRESNSTDKSSVLQIFVYGGSDRMNGRTQ